MTGDAQARITELEAEVERQKERADHWQHQFHVMGATASKAEAEVERLRAAIHDVLNESLEGVARRNLRAALKEEV